MRLSAMQKDILQRAVLASESRLSRHVFAAWYQKPASEMKKDEQNALSVSLDRLIAHGLLVGYGRKTQEKWYVDSVRLTPKGRAHAKALFGTQATLPLRRKK